MPQPRIDMRVIRRGLEALANRKFYIEPNDEFSISPPRNSADIDEAITELADELDDRDDGANILIALTKQEADVALAALRAFQREYNERRMRLTVGRITALDGVIDEIDSAIRGVVVQA